MKLIVGLGNPGPRYSRSRHNVGFRVGGEVARECDLRLDQERFLGRYAEGRLGIGGGSTEALGLLLPSTFMNLSGWSVAAALSELPDVDPECDLLVVYDDLDLPLGRLRLRPRGGDGGHRGVSSVIEALETRNIPRLRFGIGRPPPAVDVLDFVLAPFSVSEEPQVSRGVSRACAAALCALREGVAIAMDRFNSETEQAAG